MEKISNSISCLNHSLLLSAMSFCDLFVFFVLSSCRLQLLIIETSKVKLQNTPNGNGTYQMTKSTTNKNFQATGHKKIIHILLYFISVRWLTMFSAPEILKVWKDKIKSPRYVAISWKIQVYLFPIKCLSRQWTLSTNLNIPVLFWLQDWMKKIYI